MPGPAGFGPFLRQLRLARGISAKDLAHQAEISYTYVLRLERGDAPNPSLELVRRLADALGVKPEALTAAAGQQRGRKAGSLSDELTALILTLPDDDLELLREVARLLQRRRGQRRN
jgi:transcriptional regulator with XRE-family HTH domain